MRKILFLLLGILGLWSQSAMAQDRQVTGKVTSAEDGQSLPGVSVVVKGTSRGTQTDASGNYTITLPRNAGSLIFSFVGTDTKEISIANQSTINVVMANDSRSLDEVVVVGYGSESKRNITGNIASVSAKDIQNVPVPSVEQALQGKVAGVQISSLNGKLGQGLQIRVRGSSSVTASNQPLYVIDGIPVTSQDQSSSAAATNPIADLNFNDIESLQILKDASASAIYGSRASNGVVLITTKKGRAGKTQFELSGFGGVSTPTNKREFMNTQEYVSYIQGALANSAARGEDPFSQTDLADIFTQLTGGNRDSWEKAAVNTNWQDQVLRSAPVQQYDLSARGGDAKTRFFVSGGYSDQQGILIKNRFQRLSGRVNLDHSATDKLTIGVNLNVARTTNNRLSNDNAFSTPMQIVALPFFTPLTDPATGQLSNDFTLYYNPLLNRDFSSNVTTVNRLFGNLYADYKILPGLSFRTEWGTDQLIQRENQYYGRETARNISTPNGQGFDSWTQVSNYTTNNFLTFGQTFAQKHDVDATVGMSYQESSRTYNDLTAQQYPSDAYKQISSAAKVTGGNGTLSTFSFLSYFARANYRFNNRYILGLSGRIDGSSRFGANNRYGFFPAASVGWILTEESFLKNIPTLSLLKVRASYGITGNAEIGDFSSRGLYSGLASYAGSLGSAGYAGTPGQVPSQIANPDLKWEKTAQTDIGIEFGVLNNRISGEVDYYIKKTSDLLLNVNVPGSTGYRTQLRNVGNLENKGFEFVLNTQNTTGAFQWTTSLNMAYNANKITNLNKQVINGGYINRAVEGQPIGVFFSREYAGVDPANGDALYYLNTTNTDGSLNRGTVNADNVNQAQQVVLGNPNPTYIGGVTNTFAFKGIDLSVLFQGQFGNKIYNGAGQYMSANGDYFDNQTRDQLNSWKKAGDITSVPQARFYGGNGTAASSRYLQNGDFVRLKSVTLGYTIPKTVVSKLGLTPCSYLRVGCKPVDLYEIHRLGSGSQHRLPGWQYWFRQRLLFSAPGPDNYRRYQHWFLIQPKRTITMRFIKLSSLVTGLAVGLLLASCSSKLDVQPVNDVSNTTALATSTDVEAVLIGAYDALGSGDLYGGNIVRDGELLGDNGEVLWQGTFTDVRQVYRRNITTDNATVSRTWLDAYRAINICNTVLDNLATVDAAKRTRVEGEAKFIRASLYFELVRFYAKTWGDGDNTANLGVPIVLKSTTLIDATANVPAVR